MPKVNRIKIWDPLVRSFHWTLVAAFTLAYLTEDDFLFLHTWAGYLITALVVIRVAWGFVGSHYARFSDFVHSPRSVRDYLQQTLRLRAPRYLGHNPAAGAMILLLLASLLLTTLTGMAVYGAAEQAGPLAGWLGGSGHWLQEALEEVHEFFANFTLTLVIIHIAGVIVESLIHGENLVRAMINGYKPVKPAHPAGEKLS